MNSWLNRSRILIGDEGLLKLNKAHVAIFGLGGVGGSALESIVRAGVGEITIIDKDVFDVTNLNRQILSLHSNLGIKKTRVAKNRMMDINPTLKINVVDCFFKDDTKDDIKWENIDYCIDAIDTITSKILIIKQCKKYNINLISCMGTGFRMEPSLLKIDDIFNTSICPVAKAVRSILRKEGINSCTVLYSTEKPIVSATNSKNDGDEKKVEIGSMNFVPSVAGILLANYIIKCILT